MNLHTATSILLLSLRAVSTTAHTRLECPPPRSGETGAKLGPCDGPDDLSLPPYPLVPGALNTITWLESIPHPGAPGRLALSLDGDDSVESFESCLLLDHIPHDEYSVPNFGDQSSWHRSSITIFVPDVYCERCHLQFMTVMSDDGHGVPADTTCAYGGALQTGRVSNEDLPACPNVYHSCSPVSINGTVPRNEITECNTTKFEEQLNWPMKPTDDEKLFDYSTYYFKGDPGLYNISDGRLMMTGAPIQDCESLQFCDPAVYFDMTNLVPEDAPYTSMEGTCAAMVNMQVEPFESGVLPSTPKNTSAEDLVPPSGEVDPCAPCVVAKPCYNEACALRDTSTGNWAGPAAQCNEGAAFCEPCFPDSACFGFGKSDVSVSDEIKEANATIPSDTATEEIKDDVAADAGIDSSDEDGSSTGNSIKHRLGYQSIGMLFMVGFLQF